jgi:methylase of polypeptide subunit release factors
MSCGAAIPALDLVLPLRDLLRIRAFPSPTANAVDGTGAVLWPAAIALASALAEGEIPVPAAGEALDLGCGCGTVGIAAARCRGARVTLADRDAQALALARTNASANGVAQLTACLELDWGRPPPRRWPLILAADPCYLPGSASALMAFLAAALARGTDALAVVADPDRWEARHLAYHAAEAGFAVSDRTRRAPGVTEHGPVRAIVPGAEGVLVRLYELRRG